MCPDKQILSAYCDDEVPSPWKERVETHVAECGTCRNVVASYRRIRDVLQEEPSPADVDASAKRVAENLKRGLARRIPFWRRRMSVSLGAAVAAAAFLLGGGVSLTIASRSIWGSDPFLASGPSKPLDVTVNVKDIGQLLEILNNQHSIREVTIQLPETQKFEFRGEPIFLREAEYARRSRR